MSLAVCVCVITHVGDTDSRCRP